MSADREEDLRELMRQERARDRRLKEPQKYNRGEEVLGIPLDMMKLILELLRRMPSWYE